MSQSEPIPLRCPTEYWGKKSGSIIRGERMIKGKRASTSKSESRGPSGRKLRGRKSYANKKLARRARLSPHMERRAKGQKQLVTMH